MPNISDWPNAAAVCSLSQVLERGSIPQRFFLSSKACAGILRRAEKRGKQLPAALQGALESVATGMETSPKGINSTLDEGQTPVIAHTLKGEGFDASEDGTGRGTPLVLAATYPLDLRNAGRDPEKHDEMNRQGVGVGEDGDPMHTLSTAFVPGVATNMAVRRLTPVECERLQGFPDSYTNIPWRGKPEAPDGPRYKALGNSMAVPVMRWIGRRIAEALR